MHYLIRDLNQNEKPREKLAKIGAANLTDVELVALLLRSGGKEMSAIDLGRSLLDKFHGLKGLSTVDLQQLTQVKFIDVAKASDLIAAVEIGLRINGAAQKENIYIQKPEDIVSVLKKELYQKQKEHLYLISLNSRNKLVAKDLITVGTINETLLSPREVFKQAFLRNAASMVLVHNHPSNDPTPSSEDIEVTQKLFTAAAEIGIPLLDHIIVAETSFSSMMSARLLGFCKIGSETPGT